MDEFSAGCLTGAVLMLAFVAVSLVAMLWRNGDGGGHWGRVAYDI